MKLVTDKSGEPPVIWQWMNKRTRLPWSSDLRCIASMRDDGTISAAVGYNGWTHSSCWMHVAFDGAHGLTRQLWQAAFKYPFVDCGMEAIYGQTPKNLDDALSMNRRLGFKEIAQTVDCVLFEMRHDECRWLKGLRDGRKRISTAAA